jgi:catechol 2,3-dioxygenase-like lactoylglutathione lyase family enzyme
MPDFTINRIVVLTIWAEDIPAAVHFYRDVLELAELPDHGSHPTLKLNGSFLIILKGTPRPATDADPAQFPLFALAVDDLDQAVARLRAHDIALLSDIKQNGALRWIVFNDPAGNLIELVQNHP